MLTIIREEYADVDYNRPSALIYPPSGLQIGCGCRVGRIMVRTMRSRQLQGKVMDVCMWIELRTSIARDVGATCIGGTFCGIACVLDNDRKKLRILKQKRSISDNYDTRAVRGEDKLLRLWRAGRPKVTKS